MKTRILCLLLLLGLSSTRGWSQTDSLATQGDPLRELREALSGLDPNRMSTGVLMNRMMLITDPHRFDGRGDTLTDWHGWEQQYWEFYNASLNQQSLLSREQLAARIGAKLEQNAIPLLMLKYRYDELLPDAADQGLITIDSLNERVYDGPDMSRSPYAQREFFSVALAQPSGEETFSVYVGEEFWLGSEPAPASIWLNFGDAAGWRYVTMGSTVQVHVNTGQQALQRGTTAASTQTVYQTVYAYDATDGRQAATRVQYRTLSTAPDLALGLLASRSWPGFNPNGPVHAQRGRAKAIAWIKYAEGNTTGKLRKPLVFVEGIDFERNRNGLSSFHENYHVNSTGPINLGTFTNGLAAPGGYRNGSAGWNEMVDYSSGYKPLEKLPALRARLQAPASTTFPDGTGGDYDIIYLDFSDGAGLIQHNAMVLVELLEWINQPANRTTDAEETLVIGTSMGGQVARFGLAWMEQQGLCHNSKLYVSVDSPHRGANVPIGIQYLFDRLQNIWIGADAAEDVVKNLLSREATKQMCVFHYSGDATPFRNQWQAWQASPGSYPSLLRKVATANGSKEAEPQAGMWSGMQLLHTDDGFFSTTRAGAGRNYAYAVPGSTFRQERNVVFRYHKAFSAFSNGWRCTYIDWRAGHYDTAPGSTANVAGNAQEKSGGDLRADWSSNTFMPTISALDVQNVGTILSPDFSYNVQANIPNDRPNRAKYAFDAYFAANRDNEPHVQITDGQNSTQGNPSFSTNNSSWIRNELRESAHHMPAVLNTVYNLASPYRHLLPSVQVNSGGELYLNHSYLPASGGSAATQILPTGGHFEAYTSNCGTVVQINSGGIVAVGVNVASYTATLQMSRNSLLDVRAGGRLDVNAGSVLRIAAGATLVIRSGAVLNIFDGGTVIVENDGHICVENSSDIVIAGSGVYTVRPGAIFSANPSLNLSGLACTPQGPGPSPLQMNLTHNFTNQCASYITGNDNYSEWTANPSGGNGVYTYSWALSMHGAYCGNTNGFVPVNVTGPVFGLCLSGNQYGPTIAVKLTVTSGNQSVSGCWHVDEQKLALYPNPANGTVVIANSAPTGSTTTATQAPVAARSGAVALTPAPMNVTVYNGHAKVMFTASAITAPTLQLNTQDWPAGLYQVVMQHGKTTTRRQLSIQH